MDERQFRKTKGGGGQSQTNLQESNDIYKKEIDGKLLRSLTSSCHKRANDSNYKSTTMYTA